MKRHRLICELLDEVVLSERNATAGAHRSLDYLPGSAFLGAVAARLYAGLSRDDAFTVFHSGKVRFCNAAPESDVQVAAHPLPLCFHERKSAPAGADVLLADKVYNFIHSDAVENCRKGGGQPRQLRGAWLGEDGRMIRPARTYRMKTAIEASTGRAAEGQLFGYTSLLPGTRFIGEVQFDADVSDALRNSVLECLAGTVRLGRSRSAQYGRVRCKVDELSHPALPVLQSPRLVLWLLSDLAASHDGAPTFSPTLTDLGLAVGGALDPAASFIRTRRYAPYNTHRRLPDLERQVIVAGSVLVFVPDAALTGCDLERLAAGIGEWRESGLGQVSVNPPLLADAQPSFVLPVLRTEARPAMPAHPLLEWLKGADAARTAEDTLKRWVADMVREWAVRQESARRFGGLADFAEAGPGLTQWGVVATAGKHARSDSVKLETLLFEENAGICRGQEDWERAFGSGWAEPDLRTWLRRCCNESPSKGNAGLALARLAGAIQKSLSEGSFSRFMKESANEN